MTTPTFSQPHRDRALGRGVAQVIPTPTTPVSPADRAAAALAALETVPVHVGVLQAAVALLDDVAHTGPDDAVQAAARATAERLRTAMSAG
ncbi:hypothetical protein [Streptomyces sp. Ac-502]|uniref:hypothetical protein n=1 Tax=Streptomyces sp. Ac-502 TaxID=3342801 RepID=UPI003862AF05